MDSFQAIRDENIQKLREMLEEDLPQSTHAYYYFKTALEWQKKKSEFNILFLAPYDDFTDATFLLYSKPMVLTYLKTALIWQECRPQYKVLIMAPEGNTDGNTFFIHSIVLGSFCGTAYSSTVDGLRRLERAIWKTKYINWKAKFKFTASTLKVMQLIWMIAQEKAPLCEKQQRITYFMSFKEAYNISVSVDESLYTLKKLEPTDAEQLLACWEDSDWAENRAFFADMIELNRGVALFSEDTTTVLAFALQNNYGGIGFVHVPGGSSEEGFDALIVNAITNMIGSEMMDVHVNAVRENFVANELFRSCQFQKVHDTFSILNQTLNLQ